jgi:dethiobiotin synthase
LNGYYWKPIQSGLEDITDIEWVHKNTGLSEERLFPETYRLQHALSPHIAAKHDGERIDLEAFHMPLVKQDDHLIIEGAGGVMVPLNERHFMVDLMKKFHMPVLLVARTSLGTINHTLLSLEQLRNHGLDILGVVMNGPKNPENKMAIEYYGHTLVIAEVEPLPAITSEALKQGFLKYFN